ncbi:MAG: threonine/serine dehydratase [Anaerolineales bacterium]
MTVSPPSVLEAEARIRPYLRETPLTWDERLGAFLKWENQQITGSFKIRGALNKVLSLSSAERAAGLVAASAGNHGQGVAYAARLAQAQAVIFVPEHAVPRKVEAIEQLGAEVRRVPGGYAEAEAAALRWAKETGKTWVSPYNDPAIIAGQGTLGLETLRQLAQKVACWLVPVGGGGLIAGIGAALESQASRSRLIGLQAAASPFVHHLFYHGHQQGVEDRPTLADGLSGAIEEETITLPLMRRYVDQILLVSEEEIAQAIAYAWHVHHQVIEGSAAVGLAALLSGKVSERPAVVILSGGNIQPEVHAQIVASIPI